MVLSRPLKLVAGAGIGTLAIAISATMIPASPVAGTEAPQMNPRLSYDIPAPVTADDQVVAAEIRQSEEAAPAEAAAPQTTVTAEMNPDLECMAKVVLHEAGNQSREGQLAVAQLIVNRMESGRFPKTACGVANQPGQFFNTHAYNPRRDTARWAMAVEVSREALAGETAPVIPGAIFYHAAYQAPTSWFRTRQRIGALGDHIFYR
jgi:spore germination cell wall hydrolase CwlJ-like protein